MAFRRNSKSPLDEIPRRRLEKPEKDPYLAHHDESNWLISYADMMTLLCGFFIMLFSLSKLDEPKYEVMKQEIAKSFHGGVSPKPATKYVEDLVTQVVQDVGVGSNTTIRSDSKSVVIAFQSTIFFDTLSADVKPEGHIVLDRLIAAIAERQRQDGKQYRIVVEGHTDSRPILGGVFPSNWELSGARASRVVRMFLDRGFSADHLTAIGYGDTRPEFPSRTPAGEWNEEALSKNRRVVLRIMEPSVDSIPIAQAAVSSGS